MDIATIIGLGLVSTAVVGSIMAGGDLTIFIDIPSTLVVGLGVLGTTFIKWPMEVIKNVVAYSMKSIFATAVNHKATIVSIGELADKARKESIFALENVEVDDPFLKKSMTLAADNRPPEIIAAILQMEIDSIEKRHKLGQDVLDGVGADGPAMGMIGTLIGLVQMLQNLSDPSAIGPAMAVALLTTFYGAILANAFALPIKTKLEYRSTQELINMDIIIAGTLGIVAGENPRLILDKLKAFLPPSERDSDEGGGGEG